MKKVVIGFMIICCVAIGVFLVINYNSEKATLPEGQHMMDREMVSREMTLITMNVKEALKDNDVVGDIHTNYQESVTIQTSIKSSDKNAEDLKNDIEKTVAEIMKSDELKTLSNIDTYEIYVTNEDGEIMK
ncbi:DUF4030 domain-containing protein [Pseudalkalibacillus hwajinpoensis]|uniref:DUF4030 domain-containing protein n=1 Tax=Guptibacillus hwajinpoensis TaxID=208199 RepID=A0A4U1MNC8_9BACL|nr:DUF4030 domain-containing protein [Pseudalkalibacillus hwajinpoensis]TKD72314.1 DUF4030 domain-containing protein [Pseudalkalibacillus hwajinpoensis]